MSNIGAKTGRVGSAKPRPVILDEPEGLRIDIGPRRNWFLAIEGGILLCGWAVGGYFATWYFTMKAIRQGAPDFLGMAGIAVWLSFWTLLGGLFLYGWLWNIAGREAVLLNKRSLLLQRELFGRARWREFDLAHVRGLRYSPEPKKARPDSAQQSFQVTGGNLAFDYGARAYRFGANLTEQEAELILAAIKGRFPELCQA